MATSTLADIKVVFSTAGTKEVIHKVTAKGLTVEKVVEVVVKPDPAPLPLSPTEPFGYVTLADRDSTQSYAVTGGGTGSIMSVSTQSDLITRLKTPDSTTYITQDIINTNTNLATTSKSGSYFQSDKSNVTVIGLPGVTLAGFGWGWQNLTHQQNIILRNLKFRDMKGVLTGGVIKGRDYLSFSGSTTTPYNSPSHIWIDHCDFAGIVGPGLDAHIDPVNDTRNWTVSHSILSMESVAMMCSGLGTVAFNLFLNNLERTPKAVNKFLDGAQSHIHVFNNLYEWDQAGYDRWRPLFPGYYGYGIAASNGAHVLSEGNIFFNYPGNPHSNIPHKDTGIYGSFLARNNKRINSNGRDKNLIVTPSLIEVPYNTTGLVKSVMADVDAYAMLNYIKATAGATLTRAQIGY